MLDLALKSTYFQHVVTAHPTPLYAYCINKKTTETGVVYACGAFIFCVYCVYCVYMQIPVVINAGKRGHANMQTLTCTMQHGLEHANTGMQACERTGMQACKRGHAPCNPDLQTCEHANAGMFASFFTTRTCKRGHIGKPAFVSTRVCKRANARMQTFVPKKMRFLNFWVGKKTSKFPCNSRHSDSIKEQMLARVYAYTCLSRRHLRRRS